MHQIVSKMMFLFLALPTGNGTKPRRFPHKYDSIPAAIGRMYQNGTHFGYLFALKSNIHQ